jgi:hypothetical protein
VEEVAQACPRRFWLGDDPDLEGLKQPTWVMPVGPDKNGPPVKDGA